MEEPPATRLTLGPDAADTGDALARFRIATAVRDGAIAIGIMLGLLYLFPMLGGVISIPGWHWHPRHLPPVTGGHELQAGSGLSGLLVSPWAGVGVLAACAVAAVLAGGALLRLHDA
jgi:ABC-2 type transport system permease protein